MKVKDAELLRMLMQVAGVTARQASRDLGWSSHSYLNRILSGQVRTVTEETAEQLCALLQVPLPLLFVVEESS